MSKFLLLLLKLDVLIPCNAFNELVNPLSKGVYVNSSFVIWYGISSDNFSSLRAPI